MKISGNMAERKPKGAVPWTYTMGEALQPATSGTSVEPQSRPANQLVPYRKTFAGRFQPGQVIERGPTIRTRTTTSRSQTLSARRRKMTTLSRATSTCRLPTRCEAWSRPRCPRWPIDLVEIGAQHVGAGQRVHRAPARPGLIPLDSRELDQLNYTRDCELRSVVREVHRHGQVGKSLRPSAMELVAWRATGEESKHDQLDDQVGRCDDGLADSSLQRTFSSFWKLNINSDDAAMNRNLEDLHFLFRGN
ncbi:hypothetical protein GGR56DRAFT_27492 [Xylariaceae sp. FL0804]|nr:hypothetical protein GGR56DRAFT_27492 [Xylariaceae sp. FL0804]